jgi:hypothetical protein
VGNSPFGAVDGSSTGHTRTIELHKVQLGFVVHPTRNHRHDQHIQESTGRGRDSEMSIATVSVRCFSSLIDAPQGCRGGAFNADSASKSLACVRPKALNSTSSEIALTRFGSRHDLVLVVGWVAGEVQVTQCLACTQGPRFTLACLNEAYVRVVVARQITIEAKRQCQDMKCAGSVPARWLPECRAWGLYPILVGCSFESDGAFHSARARSSLPGLGGLTTAILGRPPRRRPGDRYFQITVIPSRRQRRTVSA